MVRKESSLNSIFNARYPLTALQVHHLHPLQCLLYPLPVLHEVRIIYGEACSTPGTTSIPNQLDLKISRKQSPTVLLFMIGFTVERRNRNGAEGNFLHGCHKWNSNVQSSRVVRRVSSIYMTNGVALEIEQSEGGGHDLYHTATTSCLVLCTCQRELRTI